MNIKVGISHFQKEYFIFLLPLYFVLHGLVENYGSVTISTCLILVAKYQVATLVLLGIFSLLFRSWRKATFYVFALMCFYLFFGAVHDSVKSLFPSTFLVKYSFIIPFTLVFFIGLSFAIKRSRHKFPRFVRFLNLLFLILCAIDLSLLVNKASSHNNMPPLASGLQVCDTCSKPDIYLIIADEYAGKQELKDVFNFDNSAFEEALTARSFHIIKNSKSNYNFTPFSTASFLNQSFLNNIEGSNSSRSDMNICYSLINENNTWNFFQQSGYEIINYSIFNVNDIPSIAPQNLIIADKKLITAQTFLSRVNRDIRFNLVTRLKLDFEIKRLNEYANKSNKKLFNRLLEEPTRRLGKPRFVYTHLLMPHYPYYYNSKGEANPMKLVEEGNQGRKDLYIEYLRYCNIQFITLIDTILKTSEKPPIIMFMGDHGWRHFSDSVDERYYFMNLSSIFIPGKSYKSFYDGMSNVNVMRALLNNQFHQRLPMLKDSTSFLKD
jgi:hypothetical protein